MSLFAVLVGLVLLGLASILFGTVFGAGDDLQLRLRIAAAVPFPIAVLVLSVFRETPPRRRVRRPSMVDQIT
jgi:hypothetical protein